MIRAHITAVTSLLGGVTVHDGTVPANPTPPYAVVYADNGMATVDNLDGASTFREFTVQVTTVGSTAEQARWIAEKVQAALVDKTPVVVGRRTGPIRLLTTQPVLRDDDVDPAVMYGVDLFRFASVPA